MKEKEKYAAIRSARETTYRKGAAVCTGRVGNTGYRAGEERGIWTREDYGTAAVRELTIIFIHADRKKVLHDFFFWFLEKESEKTCGRIAARLEKAQVEATEAVIRQVAAYRAEGILPMLTEAVLEKKLAWIREAKTIGALKEIAAPCVPRMAGDGTFQEGPYHVPEEEMILWSRISMEVPLNEKGYRRYEELFCRIFPEQGKEIFRTGR